MFWFSLFLIASFCALACDWLAEQKGYSGIWLLLGFLFGPLALFVIGMAPKRDISVAEERQAQRDEEARLKQERKEAARPKTLAEQREAYWKGKAALEIAERHAAKEPNSRSLLGVNAPSAHGPTTLHRSLGSGAKDGFMMTLARLMWIAAAFPALLTVWCGYDGWFNPAIHAVTFNRVATLILLVLSACAVILATVLSRHAATRAAGAATRPTP